MTLKRNVLPVSPGAGGILRGSTSCGAAVHVPSQCGAGAGVEALGRAHVVIADASASAPMTRRPKASGMPSGRAHGRIATRRDERSQRHVRTVWVIAL